MMKEKIIDLLEYTYHFNKEMIRIILENDQNLDHNIINLINHTLNAQQIWNSRILNEKSFEVWQINPLEDLEKINKLNFKKSVDIAENLDFEKRIQYKNSKGILFENSIFEMLFHAVNHSTYHRAQINSLLKQSGLEPLLTDYIFYKR